MYNSKINTNFHDNKIVEESVRCVCLSMILLHSVVRVENVNEELNLSESDDESDDESDNTFDKSDESDEENIVY